MIFKSPPTQPRYGSLIPGDPPTMLNTPPNIPKLRCHSDPHPPPGLSGPRRVLPVPPGSGVPCPLGGSQCRGTVR